MTDPMAAFAARTWAAVDSAARTIMSSSFSRLSPPAFTIFLFLPLRVSSHPRRCATNARRPILLRQLGRICLNLWSSLRYLPLPDRLNHEDANRRAAAQLSKENNGEGRAGRTGGDCGRAAPRKQGAASRGALESAVLRGHRHEDRRRRQLVLSEDADR